MGFIGSCISQNVTTPGHTTASGTRKGGPYGTGGLAVQSSTDNASPASWAKFDRRPAHGRVCGCRSASSRGGGTTRCGREGM
jgi:hypothetical protein